MTNSSHSSPEPKKDSLPPKQPTSPAYVDSVRMTGDRLINAVIKTHRQGGSSEH